MLEIRNVHKTYRPKRGVPVKALDDVSLSFGDTGLVFILGKSGSGKSTLLNVIGGLDVADSGEFVIKGKSSRDFSQADFDSYRNTFIGFIFQEYNILNEFSVGQNIALAMKLQGKKVDENALNSILEEVDLTGYGNRKPNELSGGQKQRVAIARALIKEPEIIMADEPTGALDSVTGRQVFDTLKKLSKTKLVIVVSHDREFAEYYGDRVIEFADGRVISDITKETAQSEKQSEGVSLVDGRIFHVRKGYKLTAADMKKIQAYIDAADSDTIISMDERSNASFCQIARIDQDGNQEVFKETDNEALAKENEKYDGSSRFIRSKLPFSHAFKIGSNSLRTKPFRLFITILLCFVSFAMFGLADTIAAFNGKKTTLNSIMDSHYDSVVFSTKLDGGSGYYRTLSGCSEKDLERLEEKTGMSFTGVLAASYRLPLYDSSSLYGYNDSSYYTQYINGVLTANEMKFAEYGFGELIGKMPQARDQIVITKYIYDQIAIAGLISGDQFGDSAEIIKSDQFNTVEEFLALEPVLYFSDYDSNGMTWKIVGVVDTKADVEGRFDEYKPSYEETDANIIDFVMMTEMQQYFTYGYHSLIFVSPAAYQELYDVATAGKTGLGYYAPGRLTLFQSGSIAGFYGNFSYVAKDDVLSELDVIWVDGKERTTLADNEFVVVASDDSTYWLFNSLNGNEFNANNVEINFDKTYFDGLVRITFERIQDLVDGGYYIGYLQAAQALTSAQVDKFKATLKKTTDGLNMRAQASLIRELKSNTEQVLYNYNADVIYDSNFNLPETIDELTDEELKFLYVGYLNYDSIRFYNYNESDGEWMYLECGEYSNSIGDSGVVAKVMEYEKLYYSLLIDNVAYDFKMNYMNLSYEAGGYGLYSDGDYEIVGFYVPRPLTDENGYVIGNEYLFVNNAAYEMAQSVEPLVYAFFIAPMPADRSTVEALLDIHFDKSETRGFVMRNGVTYMMDLVTDLLEVLGTVFLWVGVGLAIFSMLLLSNYIAVSISYKKREIGILRAVGAKSSDVFSIFFSESLIIALINFVLAFVVCFVGCFLLNHMLRSDYGFEITLLSFGLRQMCLMLLISVGVALIASFVPVYRLSRKKPIETIRTA